MPVGLGNLVSGSLGVVGNVGLSIGSTLLSKFLSLKSWTLASADTGEVLQGQFPADSVVREEGSNWAQIQSLNRQHAILQYLNGKTGTLSVTSRFFQRDVTDDSPVSKLESLLKFTVQLETTGRPPVLTFALGDGKAISMRVVLETVSGVNYSEPNFLGNVKHVTFTMNFIKFTPFSLSTPQVTSTRYHRTKEGEYYELIAHGEYGNALLGDAVRKQPEQVGKVLLQSGDIVKLKSIAGVRTATIAPTSLALGGSFSDQDTAQKALRLSVIDRLNKPFNSFVFETPKQIQQTLTSVNVFDETFDNSFQ